MAARDLRGRTRARAQALQLLFQAEALGRGVDDVLESDYVLESGPLDEYAEILSRGTQSLLAEIDSVLNARADSWHVSRMPAVDRSLLRMAVYEMCVVDEVDVSVTIDEVVELAKRYSTDDSSKFVNGLLGRIASDLEAGIDVLEQSVHEAG